MRPAVLGLLSALTPSLAAQGYLSGFENLTASTLGTPAAGQDGFYVPPVAGSFDGAFFTYAGNTINVPVNPSGGAIFYAGIGTTGLCRSQRNVTPPTDARCVMQADVCCNFIGTAAPVNNLGGLSMQPTAVIVPQFPTAAVYPNLIFIYTSTTAVPLTWTLSFSLGPTPAGLVTIVPDPAFTNLPLNTWITVGCTVDFRTKEYVNVFIVNGSTRTVWTPPTPAPLTNQASTLIPTDFRLFTGNLGNLMAFDNVKITWGATYESFGQGCPGAMGVPTLAAAAGSSPTLGTTLSLTLGNLPRNLAVMCTGFANTMAFGNLPLPHDLAPNGAPGCSLLVDPLVRTFLIGSGSTATWSLAIPNNTIYLGVPFFNQGVSLDTAAPGAAFSNGGRGVAGL